jgi:hypothetical protein
MSEQVATATMKGTGKRRRPRKRWREKVEEDLNTMGIRDKQAMDRDRRECTKIMSETMVHYGLHHLR